ncbi:MAG: acyl-CoA dehydrogenase family protein [bacterium]
MALQVSEEITDMKKMVRSFVRKEIFPIELEIDEKGEIPEHLIKKFKEMGFYGITIPKEYGGLGLGTLGYCLILEELAQANSGIRSHIHVNNSIGSKGILLDGTEEQKKKYLPDLASGKKLAAFGLTEPNAGSDAAAIETTAVRDGAEWVINGAKHFITNGPIADVVTVMALTDREKRARGGITAFIVEKGTPGFSVGQIHAGMGGRGALQSELIFEDCRVPVENVIGEVGQGFRTAMKTLDSGRLTLSAAALGMSQRVLDLSVDYSKQRVQFGKPIAKQQAIQFMLADMATEIHAARCMLYDAAERCDRGENITSEAAMIKLFSTETAWRVADKGLQIFGGMGWMKECPIERIYRDVRIMRIVEGTSEIQRIIISRELLRD